MCNHLLKSITLDFISVKKGFGSEHSSAQQVQCANVKPANHKMGDPVTQVDFFNAGFL